LKAVLTCAGIGTRLLPYTDQLPKEMIPVFFKSEFGIQTKPLIQLIFENLYDVGIREFCFIVSEKKSILQNHFSSNSKNTIMNSFYKRLSDSKITWIIQNSPNGFGAAVLHAESFVNDDNFILQAGDVSLPPGKLSVLKKLLDSINDSNVNAVVSIKSVEDPKRHGIVTLENNSITYAVEKPDTPPTNLGIMPVYGFDNKIFDYLKQIEPGKNNEIQLTDAIQKLIENNHTVNALRVDDEIFWDVGTPDAYWYALNESHTFSEKS
jgi:UTP--glucose-1-phosphate uridylyltransferase